MPFLSWFVGDLPCHVWTHHFSLLQVCGVLHLEKGKYRDSFIILVKSKEPKTALLLPYIKTIAWSGQEIKKTHRIPVAVPRSQGGGAKLI